MSVECPPPEQLQRLADRATAAADREPLLRHADTCSTCRAVVVAMFRGAARDGAPGPADELVGVDPTATGEATSSAAPAAGTLIGRYVIERQLGAGAMGVVYAARDPELDRTVAIKLLRPGRGDPAQRLRLQREAQAAARVTHPNVIVVHDVGLHGERVFVTMELVQGTTLRGWLARARPWREGLALALAAGRGLAAVHAAGLVHRDFKPDNVLVGDDGRVRVTDFGMVRSSTVSAAGAVSSLSPLTHDMTDTGVFVGTPAYAAPEQLRGHDADARSDQFALAVTTWEVLFGQRPFRAAEIAALVRQIEHGPPANGPDDRRVPRRVVAALRRALAAEPRDRYPSVDTLLHELAAAVRGWRRRGLAIGAAAAVGLAAIVVANRAPRARSEATPCAALADGLTTVWSDAVRARVTGAFTAGGVPTGERRAAVVVDALDRLAVSWHAARADVCVARALARPAPAEQALRIACLDERRAELGALVSALTAADGAVLERAPDAVAEVTSAAACDALPALATVLPPPAVASDVAATRRALDRAALALSLHGPAAVRRELVALEVKSEALGYPPLAAALRLVLARAAWREGDAWSAARELREGLRDAIGGHDDELATRARIARVAVLTATGELEEADETARRTRATFAALGQDVRTALELIVGQAGLAGANGRRDEAARLLEVARTTAARAVPGSPTEARVLTALAEARLQLGHTAEAATARAHAEEVWRALDGDDEGALARLSAASRRAAAANDLRAAIELGERAAALAERRAITPDQRATLHRALASWMATTGDWTRARAHARRAATLATAAGLVGDGAMDLTDAAWASQQLGEPDATVADAREAVSLARTAADQDTLVSAHLALGRALAHVGRVDDALATLGWVDAQVGEREALRIERGLARLAAAELLYRAPGHHAAARAAVLTNAGRADLAATRLCMLGRASAALALSSHGFLGTVTLAPTDDGAWHGRLHDDEARGSWSALTGELSIERSVNVGYVQLWRASLRRGERVQGWFVERLGDAEHPNRFHFVMACALEVDVGGRRSRFTADVIDRDGNLRGTLDGDRVTGRYDHDSRTLTFTRARASGGDQRWTGTLTGDLTFEGTYTALPASPGAPPVPWTMRPE